eukprot:CAMPEP_0197431484 /NCGR_PEP_ID=MMETSP1170-20131217/53204_1 /TAXON_ID=54406 /ORGANISM="Sarcinochrysis sp, Strain CCMP770" /LENGTH=357 /DNA_ID=CAMNT_0042959439 /DNA_START=153 /DNA_END=1223 /DNA_ORIENTATION=-
MAAGNEERLTRTQLRGFFQPESGGDPVPGIVKYPENSGRVARRGKFGIVLDFLEAREGRGRKEKKIIGEYSTLGEAFEAVEGVRLTYEPRKTSTPVRETTHEGDDDDDDNDGDEDDDDEEEEDDDDTAPGSGRSLARVTTCSKSASMRKTSTPVRETTHEGDDDDDDNDGDEDDDDEEEEDDDDDEMAPPAAKMPRLVAPGPWDRRTIDRPNANDTRKAKAVEAKIEAEGLFAKILKRFVGVTKRHCLGFCRNKKRARERQRHDADEEERVQLHLAAERLVEAATWRQNMIRRLSQKIMAGTEVELLLHAASDDDGEVVKQEVNATFTPNQISRVRQQAHVVHCFFKLVDTEHPSVV